MRSVHSALEQHFKSDRTRALAAAVIDGGATAHAYFCVDPKSQRAYDEHTAFEIGSVTKTMTAALLAEFIARGEVALGDSVAKLLGTSFNGPDITLSDLIDSHVELVAGAPPLVGARIVPLIRRCDLRTLQGMKVRAPLAATPMTAQKVGKKGAGAR